MNCTINNFLCSATSQAGRKSEAAAIVLATYPKKARHFGYIRLLDATYDDRNESGFTIAEDIPSSGK